MLRVKLSKFRELEPYETLPSRVKSYLSKEIAKEILSGIKAIHPKIHNISLSSNYIYRDVDSKFGPLAKDSNYKPEDIKSYGSRAYRRMGETNIIFYFDAAGGFRPNCFAEVVYKSHKPLYELNEALPDFKVSSIEYAMDFFTSWFKRSEKARNLFLLFCHYIYLPRKRKTEFWDNRDNWTYYIGNKKNGLKIYERGPDELKIKKRGKDEISGWLKKDIDRVRLEFTLSEDLKGFGVAQLEGLLKDSKIKEVIDNQIEFRCFRNKGKLPMQWEEYTTGCGNGQFNGFQEEYLRRRRAKEKIKINRDTDISLLFTDFMNTLNRRIESYSNRWKIETMLYKMQKKSF